MKFFVIFVYIHSLIYYIKDNLLKKSKKHQGVSYDMNVIPATKKDLESVLKIYQNARGFMKHTGNPDQWADTYPPEALVRSDIDGGALYLLTENDVICGVFAFFKDGDPIYDTIDGKWLNDLPHGAIHRVASAGVAKGVLRTIVEYCLTQVNNLKIDTYCDNKIMQAALEKNGFVCCGKVNVNDVGDFYAYQLYKG